MTTMPTLRPRTELANRRNPRRIVNEGASLTKLSHLAHTRSRSTACRFRVMRYEASAPASILPLLRRWRSSLPHAEPPCLAQSLRVEAQRCFRLARGIASVELADELEAIGRAFESEAAELETSRVLSVQAAGRAA